MVEDALEPAGVTVTHRIDVEQGSERVPEDDHPGSLPAATGLSREDVAAASWEIVRHANPRGRVSHGRLQ